MTPQQLKNSILQQAIEGKLVDQRPEEGNGRDLLKAIQKEKAKLVQAKKIKKEKPLPAIKEEEIPFEIPENWCWCRLGEICKSIIDGDHQAPPQTSSGIPFIVISNVSKGILDLSNTRFVDEDYYKSLSTNRISEVGDILFTVTGSYGIPIKVNTTKKFCFQRHIALLKPIKCVNYLYMVLGSYTVKRQCDVKATGTAQKTVGLNTLRNILIPLPPLEEQKRIVARLAEILPQVEIYAQAYQELQELNSKFPGQLKNSLLQKAIEGKLVEQRPEEGNGRDLLKALQKEKAQLVQAKKIKKEKPLPEIVEEEIPFEIPENWCWCRLDDAVVKEVKRGKSPTYAIDGTVMVFAQKCNTKYNGIDISLAKYLSDEVVNKYPDSEYMQDKDIVINSTGTGTMGRVGIYIVEKDNKSAVPLVPDSHVTIIRISNNMDAQYVYTVLKSQQSYFESQGDGSTKQKELKAAVIKSLLIPLPPLAEQKRIVAKLEHLLQLCQQLA